MKFLGTLLQNQPGKPIMAEFIFLMHNDTRPGTSDGGDKHDEQWDDYLKKLQSSGCFRGGSVIGHGGCFRKDGTAPSITSHIGGFIRVESHSLQSAQELLHANPVYEAGGTVEIRELPRSD